MLKIISNIRLPQVLFLILAMGSILCSPLSHARAVWPTVDLPENAVVFPADGDMVANGISMHVKGFVSPWKIDELRTWFKRSLGRPLVENILGSKHILGRAQDGYYLTVQIESLGKDGSKGLVVVSNIKKANEDRQQYVEFTQHWLMRLPSGTKIISHTASDNNGKISNYFVLSNNHNEDLNCSAIKKIMKQDGYMLEHEVHPDPRLIQHLPALTQNASTLFFKGRGKEAIASIQKNEAGHTGIVLNTIAQLEREK